MRIGLQINSFTWPGGVAGMSSKLTEIARAAEDAGFYSLWVMDHFSQGTNSRAIPAYYYSLCP